jgi:putative ABC transport system permease protein
MGSVLQDLRYGARVLAKNPGFTLVAVLTLALGIGANTAIFTVINALLLRPLPFKAPQSLFVVWGRHAQEGLEKAQVAYPDYVDLRDQSGVFDSTAAISQAQWTLSGAGDAARVNGLEVSPSLFSMLGIDAALGRTFLPEEAQPGKEHVALLSHNIWTSRYGSDPAIVGRTVKLDGAAYQIVGVLPASFSLEFPTADHDVWTPLTPSHELAGNRQIYAFEVIARLRAGVTPERASTALAAIGKRLQQAYPDSNNGRSFRLWRLQDETVGSTRPALLLLLGAVGLVLLIACANLANLLLARASARQQELAVRAALGAGQWRLARQLLSESVLLALLGGSAGLLLAVWAIDVLRSTQAVNIPRAAGIGLDGRVLAFTLGLSLFTGLLFGLAPSLAAARADLNRVMKEGARATAGRKRGSGRDLLVVGEVALAEMLLIGAGLLLVSFFSLLSVKPGFNPDNALTFQISVPRERYPAKMQVVNFSRQLAEKIRTLPEVRDVGVISSMPLSGQSVTSGLVIEGQPLRPGAIMPSIGWQFALPGYFHAMGIPLVRGRDFTASDLDRPAHATILNEAAARRFFANTDPIGKRVSLGPPGDHPDWHEVIGIVGDVRHDDLGAAPIPRAYDLLGQHWERSMYFVVRTEGDPTRLAGTVRSAVQEMDRETPIAEMRTLREIASRSVASRRFTMLLVAGFAALGLLLAMVGIYGVISYAVNRRTHEIGVRVALGAGPRDVFRLVVGQGMVLAVIGVMAGAAGALALSRLIAGWLYGVGTADPVTFAAVSILVAAVSLAACYIPARRAMRVDPLDALRQS